MHGEGSLLERMIDSVNAGLSFGLKNLQAIHASAFVVVQSKLMEPGLWEILQLPSERSPVASGQTTGKERGQDKQFFHGV